ncbi:MAG TPA: tetratricopeptide repeat protein, partial [Thermoanaerobaculia bacterium]|nr:tetratricopeptide repeat protein [Thermoanaerobaculia bacterium]
PGSVLTARALGNLGIDAFYRGDYDRAEELYRRSLSIHEKIDRTGFETAVPLNYLGVLAKTRGDFASAEEYYERALAIFEKKSPASLAVAGMENNLGVLAKERGDLDGAERHDRAALELRRRLAPASPDVAASLNNLAEIALLRGNPDAALPLIRESLEIKEKVAPESLPVASGLVNMAEYRLGKGDASGAAAEARHALDIRRRFAPGSLDEAEAFALVARAERQGGDLAAAASDYASALAAVEAQRRRVGGAEEERGVFSSRSIGYFREAVDVLHDLHRDEEAFGVLERSRGRELLALSGARDLKVDANAPRDLLSQRRFLDLQYDRAQQQIARIDPVRRRDEAEKLVARLVDLRDRRASVEQRIWSSSARLHELESPSVLTLAQTRGALDPGTAVLSYSVGEKRTLLFAVPADRSKPLAVAELPIGADALTREVAAFRGLIRQERDDAAVRSAREESGRRLGNLLLGPAGAVIAGSRRVLLCPDGPLHLLPFSALVVDGPGRARYLAE